MVLEIPNFKPASSAGLAIVQFSTITNACETKKCMQERVGSTSVTKDYLSSLLISVEEL